MNRRKRIVLVVSIALIALLIVVFPAIRRAVAGGDDAGAGRPVRTQAGGGNRTLNVNAMVMGYEKIEDKVVIVGLLYPDEAVDLSFEISGMITDIYFREGSHVKKGDLLAKVNDKPLRAELKKLEVQVPLVEARVVRQERLLGSRAVSEESLEAVKTELETLRADMEIVRARLAQTELRAPFDGMIGLRNVSEGTYASPTVVVSRLTKLDPLKLEFSLGEREASLIREGQKVSFISDRKEYTATIYAVEPTIERGTLSRRARATVPNPGGVMQPGRSVSTEFNTRDIENALLIPSIAMVAEMGRDVVYVYDGGVARQVEVIKGMRTQSSVHIIEGLNRGDTLITSGVMQLRPGMAVTIDNLN
jgi:membrane fusion protein (multidrug efflux system)